MNNNAVNPESMGVNRLRVQKWLEDNFYLDDLEITEAPLVPGGVMIKDKNGDTMLVYYDIMSEKIVTEIK